jgi:hypothetical protein
MTLACVSSHSFRGTGFPLHIACVAFGFCCLYVQDVSDDLVAAFAGASGDEPFTMKDVLDIQTAETERDAGDVQRKTRATERMARNAREGHAVNVMPPLAGPRRGLLSQMSEEARARVVEAMHEEEDTHSRGYYE